MRRLAKYIYGLDIPERLPIGALMTRMKRRWRTVATMAATVAATVAVVVGGGVPAASAIATDPSDNPCISNSKASVSVSEHALTLGQSTSLSWQFTDAPGCALSTFLMFRDAVAGLQFTLGDSTTAVTPQASGFYVVQAFSAGRLYDVASTAVTVTLPVVGGHPRANI